MGEPTFADAERFADALGRMLDTLGMGQTPVYEGYAKNTYRPEFADAIMRPNQMGAPAEYDPRRIGNVLNRPLWGGVKMPIPMSGAGYETSGWMRENEMGSTMEDNYLKADPFQQMVYGMLLRKGYPLYGPSFKQYMNDTYGPGSDGLIGFGER